MNPVLPTCTFLGSCREMYATCCFLCDLCGALLFLWLRPGRAVVRRQWPAPAPRAGAPLKFLPVTGAAPNGENLPYGRLDPNEPTGVRFSLTAAFSYSELLRGNRPESAMLSHPLLSTPDAASGGGSHKRVRASFLASGDPRSGSPFRENLLPEPPPAMGITTALMDGSLSCACSCEELKVSIIRNPVSALYFKKAHHLPVVLETVTPSA